MEALVTNPTYGQKGDFTLSAFEDDKTGFGSHLPHGRHSILGRIYGQIVRNEILKEVVLHDA